MVYVGNFDTIEFHSSYVEKKTSLSLITRIEMKNVSYEEWRNFLNYNTND